jgi:hypothetical protein
MLTIKPGVHLTVTLPVYCGDQLTGTISTVYFAVAASYAKVFLSTSIALILMLLFNSLTLLTTSLELGLFNHCELVALSYKIF